MDGSYYGDLQQLEEFFTASEKPTSSVAVVSTAAGSGPAFSLVSAGIYQDEESVDLSALLEACNEGSSPSAATDTTQRSYQEATAPTFSFRDYCGLPPTTSTTMYGNENCLGMTGHTELPTNQVPVDPTPTSSHITSVGPLGGTQPSPGKATRPSKVVKKKVVDRNSAEYRLKRDRNNVAVRKSREKSKVRVIETEQRVKELEEENMQLQTKITLLMKELNVLKSLFASAGVAQPPSHQMKEEFSARK